jgi:hypothetical protein
VELRRVLLKAWSIAQASNCGLNLRIGENHIAFADSRFLLNEAGRDFIIVVCLFLIFFSKNNK